MPATHFICPNGDKVNISDCLTKCKQGKRCMFLPTLRAIAKSVDRKVKQPSVTELISGVREIFLKKCEWNFEKFVGKNNFCVTKNVLLDFLRYNKYNLKNFKKYAKGGGRIGKRKT